MMPGETHPAAPGPADLARCQGCASLQQNLNEYVEALITLKQKIINTDNLLTEYQKKCDELQFARRENSTLHHQVEQMLQKISPLQKCQEELGSLKAELEEKKSSLKLYQDTHQEYARVKEECLKSDAQKKKLEAKVKKLEEAAVKQTQDFRQLRNEKKILEKEFKKTQERLDEFSKQKNEKDLRHIGTQISSDSYGNIDKRRVKLLLKELWLCVNTAHRLSGDDSQRVPENPSNGNSISIPSGEDDVQPPAPGDPGPSNAQNCVTKLSMEVEGSFTSCDSTEEEQPGRTSPRTEHAPVEEHRPEVSVPAPEGGNRTRVDSRGHMLSDDDLQAAMEFFKLPPPLLSPVPSPPPVASPQLASLPSSLAPETYFGECTDSSDNDSAESSEDDTAESPNYFGLFGRNKRRATWVEKPKPQEARQAPNPFAISKETPAGFDTLRAELKEPSATSSAQGRHWPSPGFLRSRERHSLDEAERQSAARDQGESGQAGKVLHQPAGNLCSETASGSLPLRKDTGPGESSLPLRKDAGAGESSLPLRKDAVSGESSLPLRKDAVSGESSLPLRTDAVSGESSLPLRKDAVVGECSLPLRKDAVSGESSLPLRKDAGAGESSLPLRKDAVSGESSLPLRKDAVSGESSLPLRKDAVSGESSLPLRKDAGAGKSSLPQRKDAGAGESKLCFSPLGKRMLNELRDSEGKTLSSAVLDFTRPEFTKRTLRDEIGSKPHHVTSCGHFQRKERQDVQGSTSESPKPQPLGPGPAVDTGVSASLSSTSVAVSACSDPQSSQRDCVGVGAPVKLIPTELHRSEQSQPRTLNVFLLPPESPVRSLQDNAPGSSLHASGPKSNLGTSNFNDQKSNKIEGIQLKGMTKMYSLPQSVFPKATEDGRCNGQGPGTGLPLRRSDLASVSHACWIKRGSASDKSTSWHQNPILRRGRNRRRASLECTREARHRLERAVPVPQNSRLTAMLESRGNAVRLESRVVALLPNQVSVITKQARPEKTRCTSLEQRRRHGPEPASAADSCEQETGTVSSIAESAGDRDATASIQDMAAAGSPPPGDGDATQSIQDMAAAGSPPPGDLDATQSIQDMAAAGSSPSGDGDATQSIQDRTAERLPPPGDGDATQSIQDMAAAGSPPPGDGDATQSIQDRAAERLPPPGDRDAAQSIQDMATERLPPPGDGDAAQSIQDMATERLPPPGDGDATQSIQDMATERLPPPGDGDAAQSIQDMATERLPPPGEDMATERLPPPGDGDASQSIHNMATERLPPPGDRDASQSIQDMATERLPPPGDRDAAQSIQDMATERLPPPGDGDASQSIQDMATERLPPPGDGDAAHSIQDMATVGSPPPEVSTSWRKPDLDSPSGSLATGTFEDSTDSKFSFSSEDSLGPSQDAVNKPSPQEEVQEPPQSPCTTTVGAIVLEGGGLLAAEVAVPGDCPTEPVSPGDPGPPGTEAQVLAPDSPSTPQRVSELSASPSEALPGSCLSTGLVCSSVCGSTDEDTQAVSQSSVPGAPCHYTGPHEEGEDTEVEGNEALSYSEREHKAEAALGGSHVRETEAQQPEAGPSADLGHLASALEDCNINTLADIDKLSTSEVVMFLESCQLKDYSSGDSTVSECSSKGTQNKEMKKELKQSEISGEKCGRQLCEEWVESEEEDGSVKNPCQSAQCSLGALSEVPTKARQELHSNPGACGEDVGNLLLLNTPDSQATEDGTEDAVPKEASTPASHAREPPCPEAVGVGEHMLSRREDETGMRGCTSTGEKGLGRPGDPLVLSSDSAAPPRSGENSDYDTRTTFQYQISTVTSEVIKVLISKDQNLVIEKGDKWTIISSVAISPGVEQVVLCGAPEDAATSQDQGGQDSGSASVICVETSPEAPQEHPVDGNLSAAHFDKSRLRNRPVKPSMWISSQIYEQTLETENVVSDHTYCNWKLEPLAKSKNRSKIASKDQSSKPVRASGLVRGEALQREATQAAAGASCKTPGSQTQPIVANADTSTPTDCSPDTLSQIRQEVGPPLPPLLAPLIDTPPRTSQALSPLISSSSPSSPASPAGHVSPLCEIPVPPILSPWPEELQQASPPGPSPSPSTAAASGRVMSSPLQFCAATPKHALPVPGRLPPGAPSHAAGTPQENSVKILDTMYPELSARARTLSLLKGNMQLARGSADGKALPGRVSALLGLKAITSTSTAFVKTGGSSGGDSSQGKSRDLGTRQDVSGKRTLSSSMLRSAKRLRLDSESLQPETRATTEGLPQDPPGGASPVDTPAEEDRSAVPACSPATWLPLSPREMAESYSTAIARALRKIAESSFDLLPVIRSHVYVGNISKKPVMRDQEKEVVYEFSTTNKHLGEYLLRSILSELKIQKTSLDHSYIHALCRVYVGICRQLGDLERARLFCYSLLKEDFPESEKLTLFIANMWNEVFLSQSVISKAMQLVARQRAKGEVLNCLRAFLSWEKSAPVDVGIMVSKLLLTIQLCPKTEFQSSEEFGEDLSSNTWEYIFAIDLLCCHQRWIWTHDNIISKELWPVMDKWIKYRKGHTNIAYTPDVIVASILRLIGRLGQLGLKEGFPTAVKNISSVIGMFIQHAQDEEIPWGVQLAAVYALCDLSPSNPAETSKVLEAWRTQTSSSVPSAVLRCLEEVGSLSAGASAAPPAPGASAGSPSVQGSSGFLTVETSDCSLNAGALPGSPGTRGSAS